MTTKEKYLLSDEGKQIHYLLENLSEKGKARYAKFIQQKLNITNNELEWYDSDYFDSVLGDILVRYKNSKINLKYLN